MTVYIHCTHLHLHIYKETYPTAIALKIGLSSPLLPGVRQRRVRKLYRSEDSTTIMSVATKIYISVKRQELQKAHRHWLRSNCTNRTAIRQARRKCLNLSKPSDTDTECELTRQLTTVQQNSGPARVWLSPPPRGAGLGGELSFSTPVDNIGLHNNWRRNWVWSQCRVIKYSLH